jgi:hypothetical protein
LKKTVSLSVLTLITVFSLTAPVVVNATPAVSKVSTSQKNEQQIEQKYSYFYKGINFSGNSPLSEKW